MKKTCAICGKPSGMYPLCTNCFKLKDEGKIVKCEICGTWHYVNQPCNCKYTELPTKGFQKCIICGAPTNGYAFCKTCWNEYDDIELLQILNNYQEKESDAQTSVDNSNKEQNPVITINEKNKAKCITCGRQTDGLLFCSSCYSKYKSKELYFKITNCTSIELLDENYEGNITCKDGHIVKSKSERLIDDYLYDHNYIHAYEKTLSYGPDDKDVLHPDFYLPHYLGENKHVYIEHWGYNENNIRYTETKKFKMEIYRKLGITLICTYERTDLKDLEGTLDRKLNKSNIKENQINFEQS